MAITISPTTFNLVHGDRRRIAFVQSGTIGTPTYSTFLGNPPTGVTLSASGVIDGVPAASAVGSSSIIIQVTDQGGNVQAQTLTFNVV